MSKIGRNDKCHCGSGFKYKKCCLIKDDRRDMLKKRIKNISRKDFISGPYKKCPKCDENTFGVFLHTSGNRYRRECTNCWHAQSYKFPPLKKKIIYLDQFVISNINKTLDPDSSSHKKALEEPFWLEVYKKIDTLSKQNLIVCPDSSFHTDESLLCGDPSYESLKEVYEHLSHGCTFYDHNTITRFQLQQHLANYMAGDPTKHLDLNAEHVIHGHPHEWTGKMRIGVSMRPYEGQLESIHKERKSHYEGLKSVFERWQKEKERDFMDWVKEEAYAFGEGTIKSHIAHLKKRAELPHKYAEQYLTGKEPEINLEDLFPPPSSQIIESMTIEMHRHNLRGESALKKMAEYLRSKYIIDIPIIHISSLLYGALARKAAHGQKSYPNMGTVTDVNAISSLLPYSDAIFIDNPMAALLNERPLKKEIARYNTKIFSLNTKEEFLKYLDEIQTTATPEHLAIVEDSYGDTKPSFNLLKNKKQSKEDDRYTI